MKLTFPPKKVQIKFALIGAGFGISIPVIIIWLSDNVCGIDPGSFCLTILYLFSFLCVISALPFVIIGQILLGGFLFGSGPTSLMEPIIFYAVVFWLLGSILWMLFTAIKKKKNAD